MNSADELRKVTYESITLRNQQRSVNLDRVIAIEMFILNAFLHDNMPQMRLAAEQGLTYINITGWGVNQMLRWHNNRDAEELQWYIIQQKFSVFDAIMNHATYSGYKLSCEPYNLDGSTNQRTRMGVKNIKISWK